MNASEAKLITELSTPTISDALDKLSIKGQCEGIKPLSRQFKIAGPAYTVKYEVQNGKKGTVGDYIEKVPEGGIVVIDNNSIMDATVWGDLLTRYAKSQKVGGTVIDGVCRDTASSLEMNYPLFSRGTYMRTGKGRVRLVEEMKPVLIGGVKVNPHDLIVGDIDGVVVIPAARIREVVTLALGIHGAEQKIVDSIESGLTLKEARKKFNYYHLQSHE